MITNLLPATPEEIAVQLGCTLKQAHGRLHYEKAKGRAKPTDRKVVNSNQKQGAHYSRLWVLV